MQFNSQNSTSRSINIHLISDSTGETLTSVMRATLSQFDNVDAKEFVWPFIKTKSQVDKVKDSISANKGVVMYTILQNDLVDEIKAHCKSLGLPCISVLSPVISEFSQYLGIEIKNVAGRQHTLDDEYFFRVSAINYAINHDDGQSTWDLHDADIVIIGVSRTSKSPTSIYLSCRGYKTANVPFVSFDTFPKNIFDLKKPLIVGLTINPEKLIQIRETRLSSMGQTSRTDYVDIESVKNEVIESKRLFSALGCPTIDVTKRSVEETAARIIQIFSEQSKTRD